MSAKRHRRGGRLRVLVTVTFTANQLRAHLLPILELADVEQLTLVSDRLPPHLPKLRGVVPPRWLVRIAGRAGAKLLVCLVLAVRERPDWVMGFHFLPHGFNARIVAAATGSRSLYHMIGGREWLGGGWSSENRVLGRLPRPVPLLERAIVRVIAGCTAIATMGERGKQVLVERGVPASRIAVVPPSVDTQRFRPTPESTRRYDVVTVSRLTENKRTADLIEGVARLRNSGLDVRVAVVGDGPLEKDLRELAARLEVDDLIEFFGFREDVENLYASSKTFVLVSASEGLPISMLEAMACGLPVVATDVGEVSSVVHDGVTGYTLRTGDVDMLTRRLRDLLEDDALRLSLGSAAAAAVVGEFSVQRIGERYWALFAAHATAGGTAGGPQGERAAAAPESEVG